MPEGSFPPEAEALIAAHIDSVDQLEILLTLRSSLQPTTAAELAASMRIGEAPTLQRLEGLAAAGLLVSDGPGAFHYAPRRPDLDRAVQQLAELYRERRVAVITQIFSKPADSLRVFADAFKFRKGR